MASTCDQSSDWQCFACARSVTSGSPTPNGEDFEVTRRLREAGSLVGVPLLDHLIVGEERYASFLERGI